MEKPRPARTRRLYLRVGQRTIGLSLSTGRGATAAALERRAFLRLSLRPGWSKWTRTRRCQSLRKSVYAISPPLLYACVVAGVCSRLCGICWLCLMAILSSVVGRRRKGPGNVRKKQYSNEIRCAKGSRLAPVCKGQACTASRRSSLMGHVIDKVEIRPRFVLFAPHFALFARNSLNPVSTKSEFSLSHKYAASLL